MVPKAKILDHSHTALIIVDNQVGAIDSSYYGTKRSNPSYEGNIKSLLAAFRSLKTTHVIHIQHSSINPSSPLRPDTPGIAFHESSLPREGETIIKKSYNSAFIGTDLEEILKKRKIWTIFFVGLSVDLCLGSTVRAASDLRAGEHTDNNGVVVKGNICLVGDATLAWAKHDGKFDAETIHGVHLESLKNEFSRILTTDEALKEIGKPR